MQNLKLFLKGFVVGIGKIIPGVSGSVMAIVLGIYERLILALSSFKNLRRDFFFVIVVGLGILLAILLGSKVIYYLLINHYLYTLMVFIGMMIPGVLSLFKNVQNKDVTYKRVITALMLFFLLILFTIVPLNSLNVTNDIGLHKTLSMVLCGFLDAASTIIPGISGSAILMMLGYYELIIASFGNVFCLESYSVIIPFAIGMALGVVIISKLITYLFKNYRELTYMLIIVFAVFSIFTLFKDTIFLIDDIKSLSLSLVFLIIGFLSSFLLDKVFKS